MWRSASGKQVEVDARAVGEAEHLRDHAHPDAAQHVLHELHVLAVPVRSDVDPAGDRGVEPGRNRRRVLRGTADERHQPLGAVGDGRVEHTHVAAGALLGERRGALREVRAHVHQRRARRQPGERATAEQHVVHDVGVRQRQDEHVHGPRERRGVRRPDGARHDRAVDGRPAMSNTWNSKPVAVASRTRSEPTLPNPTSPYRVVSPVLIGSPSRRRRPRGWYPSRSWRRRSRRTRSPRRSPRVRRACRADSPSSPRASAPARPRDRRGR